MVLKVSFSIIKSPALHNLERDEDEERQTELEIRDKDSAVRGGEAFILF